MRRSTGPGRQDLDPQGLAIVAWSFATVGRKDEVLLQRIAEEARSKLVPWAAPSLVVGRCGKMGTNLRVLKVGIHARHSDCFPSVWNALSWQELLCGQNLTCLISSINVPSNQSVPRTALVSRTSPTSFGPMRP